MNSGKSTNESKVLLYCPWCKEPTTFAQIWVEEYRCEIIEVTEYGDLVSGAADYIDGSGHLIDEYMCLQCYQDFSLAELREDNRSILGPVPRRGKDV